MTKVVYNHCHGGFSLSVAAIKRFAEIKGVDEGTFYDRSIPRSDPALVQVVEEMGSAANGAYADLRIAEVASGSKYRIDEYDGMEAVMTIDDYEWQTA